MQTRNDGTHVIWPAAAPIARRPDRAGLPVTLLRQPDGKVCRDGSSADNKQRSYPVDEPEECTAYLISTTAQNLAPWRVISSDLLL
jgi:hypothetical protein